MTQGFKGMRSGISLVEMMIAIILFGVISVIGYKYYKNYLNTTLAAKQVRIATIIDQATQISNAYDIYVAKMGTAPTLIADLSANTVKILTKTPDSMPEITGNAVTDGWLIDTTTDFDGATTPDVSFSYAVTGSATNADKLEYCNVVNNFAQKAWSLDTIDANIGTALTMYAGTNTQTLAFTGMMCYQTAPNTYKISFLKKSEHII